ncbi:MAG: hypothetical protein PHP62_04345 [Candidatus Moranbacteria bacterium]|nr:hypothetical protein [Candidatus Moranbacteria bacterium]
MIGLWLTMAILAMSAFPAMADDGIEEMVTVRRSILINGEFQRYMPYPFTVTSVNCGVLETSEMKKSNSFFGEKGVWEKKFTGELVSSGWYRFKITGADLAICAPVMDISSEVPKWYTTMYIGSFMEVEPEDLGLLVKGGMIPNNFFGLSTDDSQFSYELVAMSPGTERSLDSFKQNTHFFSDTGRNIVGAIVADGRGFLKNKIMFNEEAPVALVNIQPALPKHLPKGILHNPWVIKIIAALNKPAVQPPPVQLSPAEIMVREGDIVVLIRDETKPY